MELMSAYVATFTHVQPPHPDTRYDTRVMEINPEFTSRTVYDLDSSVGRALVR